MKNFKIKNCAISFVLMLLICCVNYFFSTKNYCYAESKYYYTDNIEHIFTHCLIAYPEIAFAKDNYMAKHYARDCITAREFIKILDQLYKNNYALVDINCCFSTNELGIVVKQKVKMPIGKKPLILSFDDVNYDQTKKGLGMVDKIVLDEQNNLAAYTYMNNFEDIRYDNEFIPILENFVKIHPDFSINGAKGTICLTGYDGILGYRTSHTNTTNRDNEIKAAKKVIAILKQNGWNFASHSYGHYHMKSISNEKFEHEINLWQDEVAPIVGNTSVYVYPYGEWEVFESGQKTKKHILLEQSGFKLFCGVGLKPFFSYLPNNNGHKVLFMDRKCIDGNTLTANRKELQPFFNPLQILDSSRNKI
ncbi:MAG: hypothetical protein E7378_00465 [Clostridiales bacterium]|nr:hypothetical protein [Clostridiales bacterium]